MENVAENTYDAESIKVLKGLEAVRKRPGMYIGDPNDGTGLHQLVYEAVDNAIDEALAGHCDQVTVTLHIDGGCSVEDNGRGIPVGMHPEEGRSAAEVIMTVLHAGKFDYTTRCQVDFTGGYFVTLSSTRAHHLSRWTQALSNIVVASRITIDSNGEYRVMHTHIRFLPDTEIFSNNEFSFDILSQRLWNFLNKVKIVLDDERDEDKKHVFMYEGGIASFVEHLTKNKSPLHPDPIYFNDLRDDVEVEVALQWTDAYQEQIHCFTNNIRNRDGGTHLSGFRDALTRTVNSE